MSFISPKPTKFTPAAGTSAKRGECLHLGKRIEFKPGCGGAGCKHECDAGKPFAVPNGNCQACNEWTKG